jgi:hypothetical protein
MSQVPLIIAQLELGESEQLAFMGEIQRQELVMVGWSAQAQAMLGMRYGFSALDQEFTETPLHSGDLCIVPGEGLELPADPPESPAAMLALIQQQIAFVARTMPEKLPGFGGDMVTAEITRDEIRLCRRALVGPGG